jgi:predicted PurR-regulated permease PerM
MTDDGSAESQQQRRPDAQWVRRLTVLFVWLVAIFLFVYFFNAVATVILGVLAAAIVATTLHPLLRFIPGPRGVAAGVLGLSLIVLCAGLVLALSWPLAAPLQNAIENWSHTAGKVDKFLATKAVRLGIEGTPHITDIFKTVGNFLTGSGGGAFFTRSADVIFGILLWLVFIFIGSIFLLTEPASVLINPASMLVPPRHREQFRRMFYDLEPRLRRWVIGTLISMSIVFTASLIGYTVIGLQLAAPLALLAGLCEIVPTVGPAVAAVVAALFAAATGGGGTVAGVAVVYGIIQSVEAYVILPMIMKGAVKIHPAVTLFSVVLWGKIFGVPGLMLAIPINLTLWAAAERFVIQRQERLPAVTAGDIIEAEAVTVES